MHWMRLATGIAFVLASASAQAQPFIPPAGYSGHSDAPGVTATPEPGSPKLTRIPDADVSKLFQLSPDYSRAAHARVKVVGTFAVAETHRAHLVAAWSMGYLPVTLQFSDGRCFSLSADYTGTLSNGRLESTGCGGARGGDKASAPPRSDGPLQFIGSSWGYGAWAGDHGRTTIVTAPIASRNEALFTARMDTRAIMAMNGPDWPGGNVTLVGRIKGRLTVVTLEVGY